MGGYAAFVWPAYTIALAVLIANVVQPLIQHKKILQQLQHDE
jgi:heme exporter protein D